MHLVMHGPGVGVDGKGQWWERRQGKWHPIPHVYLPARQKKAPVTAMPDPQQRPVDEVPMVTVRRVVRKTVPDYEAVILVRNGWEYDTGDA